MKRILSTCLLISLPCFAAEIGSSVAPGNSEIKSDQVEECRDLKPGETRVVKDAKPQSYILNERRYRVTRDKKDPKQINIELNMSFQPNDVALTEVFKGASGGSAAKLNSLFVNKANECFKHYAPILRDANGTHLNVHIISDPENTKIPLAPPIAIAGKDEKDPKAQFRSDRWPTDIDCSLIIHESLHLTGLVDGYPSDHFNCRHVEPRDSIYNSASWALDPRVELSVCICNSGDCANQTYQVQSNAKDLTCPPGWTTEAKDPRAATTIQYMNDAKGDSYNRKGVLIKTRAYSVQPTHALKTSQIMTITRPRCLRDSLYLQCAANAYRNRQTDGCIDTPKSCQDESWAK